MTTETKTRAKGAGRKPVSSLGNKTHIGFRLDPELVERLDAYLADTPDYSKTSTLNLALKRFLDIETLPVDSDAWEEIQGILARYYEGYVRTVNKSQGVTNE